MTKSEQKMDEEKKEKQEVVMNFDYPLCFESEEEYKFWRSLARISPPGNAKHCADCTPNYKYEMMKAGRCENPDIRFATIDGELVGRLPWKE